MDTPECSLRDTLNSSAVFRQYGLDFGDAEMVGGYGDAFRLLGLRNSRIFARSLILHIEPHMTAKYPDCGDQCSKPEWLPDGLRHTSLPFSPRW